MKKYILYFPTIVLLFSLVTILQACDNEDSPFLDPSVTTLSFEAEETTKTFTITSNVGWVISSEETWYTFTPEFGSGSENITVTLDGINEGSEVKTGTLTIKSGQTGIKTIEIEQASVSDNGGEEPEPEPIPVNQKEIIFDRGTPMTKYGYWYYFSFETGEVVDTISINKEKDAIWKEREDWDIAFSPFYSKTNGGISGKGLAGVIKIEEDENSESDKGKLFSELVLVPEEGYFADEEVQNMIIALPPPEMYTGGGNKLLNTAIILQMGNTTSVPTVFAIKTAKGLYGKLYIKEWSDSKIIFEYTYQPDGTPNLVTIE